MRNILTTKETINSREEGKNNTYFCCARMNKTTQTKKNAFHFTNTSKNQRNLNVLFS